MSNVFNVTRLAGASALVQGTDEGESTILFTFEYDELKGNTALKDAEADFDATNIVSMTFAVEWPPRSGRMRDFPEVDAAAWLDIDTAREKLVKGQRPMLDALLSHLAL